MKLKTLLGATLMTGLLTSTAAWAEIMVKDAYARSSTPNSKTGAAFMMVMNHGDADDRLIAASSDIAKRVELHTHMEDENGVMKMTELEDGMAIPAGGAHHLKRGGDHVMFMGLTQSLVQGEEITITLTFEKAGEVDVTIPVDNDRKPTHGGMDHSHTDHGSDS
ncbi:copper chaperone PCu(A)C [uncultured Sulfitobacter sp.]|uniref:copper chaperone PCu(A)C n=1 Tax=uncultured Sulfitobacter sp. TaxID=191468 RepID=UPI002619C80E|nr:copper chaperone PCu(A)C [uncultured Sulfitobacter sp.]